MDELNNGMIKKKHIWPAILMFLIVACICLSLIVASAGVFAMYVLQSKMQQVNATNKVIADMIRTDVYGMQEDSAALYFQSIKNTIGKNVYVTDNMGNEVFATGRSHPVLEQSIPTFFGSQYLYYEDSQKPFSQGKVLYTSIEKVVSEVMKPKDKAWNYDAWWNQPLYSMTVWNKISVDIRHDVYLQNQIDVGRQDLYFFCIFCVLALVVMMVTLLILFANALASIKNQRKLRKMLYLDPITGGKNWIHFKGHVRKTGLKQLRKNRVFAIVDIRMDKFESYSSCYGAKSANELLKRFSSLLQIRTTRKECFARIADAQFSMFLLVESKEQCQTRLRTLLAELSGIMSNQKISLSTGVFFYDLEEKKKRQSEIDVDALHSCAVSARKSGLAEGNFPITFFSQDMMNELMWERRVEDRMEEALENKEFVVYLQPKYNPNSRRLIGAEALVRWNSPEDGFVSPGRFIPLFEENGFITRLDDFMLSEVSRLQTEWTLKGQKTVPISVNISRVHFAKDNLAQHICSLVDDYGTDHDLIELEVTESAFFDDKKTLVNTLNTLKEQGFDISMDDFGAGYSSLNSLKDLPLDVLKLDGEFFRGDFDDERGQVVVKQAIALARNLKMRVVAEGVEKEEQVIFLAEQNCDMIQGFYFARPMPVAEFEERLALDA